MPGVYGMRGRGALCAHAQSYTMLGGEGGISGSKSAGCEKGGWGWRNTFFLFRDHLDGV